MTQFVCLSSEPWQAAPTRTQQLMTRLKNAEVLYFEPPHDRAHRKPGRKLRPGLTLYTLPPILELDERNPLFSAGQKKLARFIASAMERHRFKDPVLWTTSPQHAHLTDLMPHRGLVYDCDRYQTRFPPEWESDLAMESDVVFAASPGLVHRLRPCTDNVALLPNGVNYPMFSRSGLEKPPEFRDADMPILGFAGDVTKDLDLFPVCRTLRALPNCGFVFIGKVEDNPLLDRLNKSPNVVFAGERRPADLPEYLNCFDVCMNLLRHRDEGDDVIPERFYEYLSTGSPIVSMLWDDQVEVFPDVVYGAHSDAEFAGMCRRALAEADDWAVNRRREYGAGACWSERVEEIHRILGTIGLY